MQKNFTKKKKNKKKFSSKKGEKNFHQKREKKEKIFTKKKKKISPKKRKKEKIFTQKKEKNSIEFRWERVSLSKNSIRDMSSESTDPHPRMRPTFPADVPINFSSEASTRFRTFR